MTEQTTPATAIEPALDRGRVVLRDQGTLQALRDALSAPPVVDAERKVMVPFPDLPKPVVLTKETKQALARLKDVFAVVQPETRRSLTEAESVALYEERTTLDSILDLLTTRREAISTLVKHHMDVSAEEAGLAFPVATDADDVHHPATPRDANGNYILAAPQDAERATIPGTNMDWSREYRKGKQTFNPRVVEEMLAEGQISREAYLAMTRETRVFDEDKAMIAARKKSLQDDVLKVIKAATGYSSPGTSLFVRKTK